MIVEKFKSLLDEMVQTKIPDIHITSGNAPHIRKTNGDIERIDAFGVLSREEVEELIREITHRDTLEQFYQLHDLDLSYSMGENRFRINIFENSQGLGIAIRFIPFEIPTCQDVSLPQSIIDLLKKDKGFVLVTGPTGSGKSTTLAAMVEHINQTQKRHIITVEDPIEFNFKSKLSLVHQREVGTHTKTFANAIRSALREDPDVVMVGEMRDPETMSAALTLAETGHLVFATLHTNDTVQSIDRIIDSFPAVQQNQVRIQVAMALTAVVSQTLLPKKDGHGRIVCREILMNTDAVRSLIMQ